jgi:hypothetical protein
MDHQLIEELREAAKIAMEVAIVVSLGVGIAVLVFFVWYSN